jgi:hypothetical protein
MRTISTRPARAVRCLLVLCGLPVLTVACGDEAGATAPLNTAGTFGSTAGIPATGITAGTSASAGTGTGIGATPAAGSGTASGAAGTISSAGAAGARAGTGATPSGTAGLGTAGLGAAGTGSTVGAAGTSTTVAGASAAAGSGGVVATGPSCKGMASQGVIIGDSYINWPSHTLPADLAEQAGETWRLYAVGGASLQAGGIIPQFVTDQFEQAITEDKDIKLLVMDGGGNDVLLADTLKYPGSDACTSSGSSKLEICKQVVTDTLAAFNRVITRAAEIGVQNIVFFFYPTIPNGTALGGPMPNEIADYARPMWKATCDGAEAKVAGKLKCHFVDMVPVFKGHDDWFAAADIHPTPEGSAAMAKAILAKMKEDCVWQPAGSMCCH